MMNNSRKVLIIGDSNVGKTSILFRYVFDKFDDQSMPTLGAGFKTKEVAIKNKLGQEERVKLNLWDTAGQEKFDSLTKMYFKGAEGAIIVYDVTCELSFEKAQKWVRDLAEQELSEQAPILKFLVGNKCDMVEQKEVSISKGSEYAKKIGATSFAEISAKENTGITELFEGIARAMLDRANPN